MSLVKDAVNAMKEVLLLTEKINRAGQTITDFSKELRDQDRRLVRLETFVEIAQKKLT
jgi:hypothetical protein